MQRKKQRCTTEDENGEAVNTSTTAGRKRSINYGALVAIR
jgi:outer membrane lipoprotein SlyB